MFEEIVIKNQELSSAIDRMIQFEPSFQYWPELKAQTRLIETKIALLVKNPNDWQLQEHTLGRIAKLNELLVKFDNYPIIPKINWFILRHHYQQLYNHLKSMKVKEHKNPVQSTSPKLNARSSVKSQVNLSLSSRQKAILQLFNQSGKKLQLKDIMLQFRDLTDRTIRLDLWQLVRAKCLNQTGFGRGSFYTLSIKRWDDYRNKEI